jgi:hypothetical protein
MHPGPLDAPGHEKNCAGRQGRPVALDAGSGDTGIDTRMPMFSGQSNNVVDVNFAGGVLAACGSRINKT